MYTNMYRKLIREFLTQQYNEENHHLTRAHNHVTSAKQGSGAL